METHRALQFNFLAVSRTCPSIPIIIMMHISAVSTNGPVKLENQNIMRTLTFYFLFLFDFLFSISLHKDCVLSGYVFQDKIKDTHGFFTKILVGGSCFRGRCSVPIRAKVRWGDSHQGWSQMRGTWKSSLRQKMPLQQN